MTWTMIKKIIFRNSLSCGKAAMVKCGGVMVEKIDDFLGALLLSNSRQSHYGEHGQLSGCRRWALH